MFGFFHFWAIMNKDAMTIHVQVFVSSYVLSKRSEISESYG